MQREITIPNGAKAALEGKKLTVEGKGQKLDREFDMREASMEVKDGKVVVTSVDESKKSRQVTGSMEGHVKNMFEGLEHEFVYKLKTEHKHFPLKITVKGERVEIGNYLGQKSVRSARIFPGVKVEVKDSEITVKGRDVEKTGQTAAGIENASKQSRLCDRKFLDGVYIVEKP